MAATVRAAYVLEDRASGTARKIKHELSEVEKQALAAGVALDAVSDPKRTRQLNEQATAIGRVDQQTRKARTSTGQWHTTQKRTVQSSAELTREVDLQRRAVGELDAKVVDLTGHLGGLSSQSKRTKVGVDEIGTSSRRSSREVGSLGDQVRKAGITLVALNKIIGVMKWPALIAGVGGAVQVVGALGLGVTALVPLLGEATLAGASAIPVYAGLGAAMVTTKLATNDLGKALGGNKEALKGLTPEARGLLGVLRELQGEQRRLQRSAQQGLFPGVTEGLQDAVTAAPELRAMLRQTGGDLGGLAASAGRSVSQGTTVGRRNIDDLQRLSDVGGRALGNLGRAGGYAARALLSVGVAAEPLTDWVTGGVEDFAKMAAEEARVAQQTGRMGRAFDGAKDAVQTLGRIGGSVLGTIRNVMGAASDTSDDLWDSLEGGADAMERWTGSVEGQLRMRKAFDEMRPVLRETVGLAGDLAKAAGRLATSPGGAQMLGSLRDAVPEVEAGMESLTQSFGPAAIGAVSSIVELIGTLAQQNGPLVLVAKAIGGTADAITATIDVLGPFGNVLATVFGASLLMRRVQGLRGMASAILGVGRASKVAAADVAASNAITGAGAAAAGAAGRRAGPAGRGGAAPAPGSLAWYAAAGAGTAAGGAAAGGRLAGLGGRALGLGRAAGRVAAPLAVGMAALDFATTEGNVGRRLLGAASGATFGLIPRPKDADELVAEGQANAARAIGGLGDASSIDDQRGQLERLRARQGRQTAAMNAQGHVERRAIGATKGGVIYGDVTVGRPSADTRKRLKGETDALAAEIKRRESLLRDSLRTQRDMLDRSSVQHANGIVDDLTRAFGVRSRTKGPVAAMEQTTKAALEKLRNMRPAGAKIVGENTLAWARQQAKGNPTMLRVVRQLEREIEDSFSRTGEKVQVVNGRILRGSRSEWKDIRSAITSETEKARQEATDDFTSLQREAIGSLVAMGFNRSDARKIVQGIEKGGTAGKRARSDAATGPIPTNSSGGTARKSENDAAFLRGHARGGRLGGIGLQDTLNLGNGNAAAPGELVVNRHSERDVDAILSEKGLSLAKIVGRETKPHSAEPSSRPRLGFEREFARGGRTAGIDLMGAKAGLAVYAQMAAKYGLHVSSGGRPGAITSSGNKSQHSTGDAIDLAGSTAAMLRFARVFSQQYGPSVDQLIYTPLGYGWNRGRRVKSFGAQVDADHFDHVHIGDATPGGAAGAVLGGLSGDAVTADAIGTVKLKRARSKRGGVPGALSERAMNARRAGFEQKLNEAIAASGGAMGADPTGAGGVAPKGQVRSWLAQALRITGHYSPANLNALYGRAMQESGGNPSAVNNWDSNAKAGYPSRGLLQTIPQTFNAYRDPSVPGGITDPVANAVAAIRYMFARYGHIVGANGRGYALGGRLGGPGDDAPAWGGWNAKGGTFKVDRPTIFGAGEAGEETVKITPRRRGGAAPRPRAGGSVTIEKGAFVIHAGSADAAEVARLVEEKLSAFVDMLSEEMGVDDDETEQG